MAKFTALPPELHTITFSYLHKADLKSLRLVCRSIGAAPLHLLFDRVIISSHEPNYEPFERIVNDPRFSTHVKSLTYDISWFDDLPLEAYLRALMLQMRDDVATRIHQLTVYPSHLEKPLRLVRYFQDGNTATTRSRQATLLPWWPEIERGYAAYRSYWTHNHYVQSSMVSDMSYLDFRNKAMWKFKRLKKEHQLIPTLVQSNRQRITLAIKNCRNLQRVEVCANWTCYAQPIAKDIESLLPRYHSSGFLSRHWATFWLRPKKPAQDRFQRRRLEEDIFDILHDHGKELQELLIRDGSDIRPDLHVVPTSMHMDMPYVFASLTELFLDVSVKEVENNANYVVAYLFPALRAAQNLKRLTFRGRNNTDWRHADFERYNFSAGFPHSDLTLPRLVSVHLSEMHGFANDFIEFLRNHPLLHSFHLSQIDLMAPTEELHNESFLRLVESLRSLQNLRECSLGWPVRINGIRLGNGDWDVTPLDWPTFERRLEDYVLRRGENPMENWSAEDIE
ncbi:MAG: hypothetical protein LQ348_004064 [Seirophora lacunosa]|nr:MAG: hypothetical protein LQ348_004064 [Seirophora lacunosa]